MPRRPQHDPHEREHDEERDFDAEFEALLLAHDLDVTIEDVFHLNPQLEEAEDIRRHSHVVLRSRRSRRSLAVCLTSFNWDDAPVHSVLALATLAADANLFERSDGSFISWALAQDYDPDSRAAERKFRQTGEMVAALRAVIGERGFADLLALQADAAAAMLRAEEDEGDEAR